MKKVVALFAILLIGMGSSLAGDGPKSLYKEINRKIKLDFRSIQLDRSRTDYVMVKFQIIDSEIHILQINGSHDELAEMIQCELEEMIIKSDYEEDKTYRYKFTFQQEG